MAAQNERDPKQDQISLFIQNFNPVIPLHPYKCGITGRYTMEILIRDCFQQKRWDILNYLLSCEKERTEQERDAEPNIFESDMVWRHFTDIDEIDFLIKAKVDLDYSEMIDWYCCAEKNQLAEHVLRLYEKKNRNVKRGWVTSMILYSVRTADNYDFAAFLVRRYDVKIFELNNLQEEEIEVLEEYLDDTLEVKYPDVSE
jgi:hypothetical protein